MATHKDIDPRGFLLNDNDTGVDHLGESTLADAIAESVHHVETPITIGLYAKWGSGKSFLLRHLESILKRYEKQSIIDDRKKKRFPEDGSKCANPHRAVLWTLFILVVPAIMFGTVMLAVKPEIYPTMLGIQIQLPRPTANVPTNESYVKTTTPVDEVPSGPPDYLRTMKVIGLVFIPIEILIIFMVGCCGNSWLSRDYYGSCRLLTYGAFTKLPIHDRQSDIVEDPGELPTQVLKHIRPGDERLAMAATEAELFPRRYLFVDFKAWEYAGSDTLWAGIITNITDAIEVEFGVITARMFRMLKIEKIPRDILDSGARIIYIELAEASKELEVLDMMKQYGVVTDCKRIGRVSQSNRRFWKVVYSSDGECRCAKECLAIEGVNYRESDPAADDDADGELKNSRGESRSKLLPRKDDDVELKVFPKERKVPKEEQDALDRLTLPPKTHCCNRFCSHFLKYPTTLLCMPRLVWWILILLCSILIPIFAYVLAEYLDLDIYRTYRVVPIVGQILLWLPAGIAVTAFVIKFIWAMCHSQRKRINEALDGTRTKMADQLGFMSKVKSEIEVVTRLIQCARFTHQKDYKIVITIDDLDRVPLKKIQSVLEAVSILLSHKSSPFICLIAVDPRIVVKCIEEGMGDVLRQSKITGHEYLKKIINLPICLPEITDADKKRFIAGLIDQADHTITYREQEEKSKIRPCNGKETHTTSVDAGEPKSIPNARKPDGNIRPHSWAVTEIDFVYRESRSFQVPIVTSIRNLSLPCSTEENADGGNNVSTATKRNSTRPVVELDHKQFLFHCRKFIYDNEQLHKHMQGNPRNIKRVFNVISLTANIINNFLRKQKRRNFIQSHAMEDDDHRMAYQENDKIVRTEEFAEDLVRWIVLADQWPYRTNYVLQVIEDAEQRASAGLESEKIPDEWTIFEIFQNKVKEECEKGDPSLLSLDADPDLFYSYIILLKYEDFTVGRMKQLEKYTVNLDYSVRHTIAFQRDLSCLSPFINSRAEPDGDQDSIPKPGKKEPLRSPDIIVEHRREDVAGHIMETDFHHSLPNLLVHA